MTARSRQLGATSLGSLFFLLAGDSYAFIPTPLYHSGISGQTTTRRTHGVLSPSSSGADRLGEASTRQWYDSSTAAAAVSDRASPTMRAFPGIASARTAAKGIAAAAISGVVLTESNTRRAALIGLGALAVGAIGTLALKVLDTPSRPYDSEKNTVGNEYDAWTEDGILESYWGEHIHLGYYTEEERRQGAFRKNFVQAKYDFIDEMMTWGDVDVSPGKAPEKVLDVGCGVGGTSRFLAKKLGSDSSVTGITLSPKQVERGTQLAEEQGVANANFRVMNALDMEFEDDTFDLVWACESGEHMPDKGKYIDEMTRVLKPGGKLLVATWCQRDNSTEPFTPQEEKKLDFLYSEWTHPHFISIQDYGKLMEGTGKLERVEMADWAEQTLPTWRLSIWVGVVNPWPWLRVPKSYYKTVRDAWCIERMHQAFKKGLMQYGMIKGVKKRVDSADQSVSSASVSTTTREADVHSSLVTHNTDTGTTVPPEQIQGRSTTNYGGQQSPAAPGV